MSVFFFSHYFLLPTLSITIKNTDFITKYSKKEISTRSILNPPSNVKFIAIIAREAKAKGNIFEFIDSPDSILYKIRSFFKFKPNLYQNKIIKKILKFYTNIADNKNMEIKDIKKTKEYLDCKKSCKKAVYQNGSYSYQVISYSLLSLKEKFGDEAVKELAKDVPEVNDFVIIS